MFLMKCFQTGFVKVDKMCACSDVRNADKRFQLSIFNFAFEA